MDRIIDQLVSYAAELKFEDIPGEVVQQTKRMNRRLDWMCFGSV